jgi:hypothetical protein
MIELVFGFIADEQRVGGELVGGINARDSASQHRVPTYTGLAKWPWVTDVAAPAKLEDTEIRVVQFSLVGAPLGTALTTQYDPQFDATADNTVERFDGVEWNLSIAVWRTGQEEQNAPSSSPTQQILDSGI